MRKITLFLLTALAAISSEAGYSHAVISRQAFVAAMDQSCPHCQPYLQLLRQVKGDPAQAEKLFVKRRKMYFPGAKDNKVAGKLARRTFNLYHAFYSFLAHGKTPGDPAVFVRFSLDTRISGGLRSSAAWFLYLLTHKPEYAVMALKLHDFEVGVFEHVKDPQFPLILSRIIKEIDASPRAYSAGPLSATASVRFAFPAFVGAALFQGVPKSTRTKLFMLYRPLVVAGPGFSRWYANAFANYEAPPLFIFSPAIAPVVVKKIRPFGRLPLLEFLRALARQGLVKDLSQVVRTLPGDEGLVRSAVSQVLVRARGQQRKMLTDFLKDPLAASKPAVRRHPGVSHPADTAPVPPAVVPTQLPGWLSVNADVVRAKVLAGQGFATAVFRLRNKSTQVVSIMRIWTSCGCTTAHAKSNEIRPGHSITVTGRIRLAGLPLPVTRYVYVQVELAGHPNSLHLLRLEIRAKKDEKP